MKPAHLIYTWREWSHPERKMARLYMKSFWILLLVKGNLYRKRILRRAVYKNEKKKGAASACRLPAGTFGKRPDVKIIDRHTERRKDGQTLFLHLCSDSFLSPSPLGEGRKQTLTIPSMLINRLPLNDGFLLRFVSLAYRGETDPIDIHPERGVLNKKSFEYYQRLSKNVVEKYLSTHYSSQIC